MKPYQVRVARKFNLGNYESEEIEITAFVEDGENEEEVMKQLEAKILDFMQREETGKKPYTCTEQPTFPEEYQKLLKIEDAGSFWKIKPVKFLGSENFSGIAEIVKQYGGEYVSAGKDSHFRIPK